MSTQLRYNKRDTNEGYNNVLISISVLHELIVIYKCVVIQMRDTK